MAAALNNKLFQDPTKARVWLEKMLWAGGRSCGYCGVVDESSPIKGRDGYYQCKACRKQFTVLVGTLFERSHIPLNKWLMAAFLLCASKKGISAHQMHRMLGITYKSAWFMMHRLREAMKPTTIEPFGSTGGAVEADETYIGTKADRRKKGQGPSHKHIVVALVERGGRARSFYLPKVGGADMKDVLNDAWQYKPVQAHGSTSNKSGRSERNRKQAKKPPPRS